MGGGEAPDQGGGGPLTERSKTLRPSLALPHRPAHPRPRVCQVGHALGLKHSKDPMDVMAPYYVPGRVELADGDKEALKALYG